MSNTEKVIGSRIRQARKEEGMTLKMLGTLVGVSFQQISKYEHGIDRVSAEMLWKIARSLRRPIDIFLIGAEEDSDGEQLFRAQVHILANRIMYASAAVRRDIEQMLEADEKAQRNRLPLVA